MIYSHRNGETAMPTMDGAYWFRGRRLQQIRRPFVREWTTDTGSLIQVYVGIGEILPYGGYWTNGNCLEAVGEWWGPVVAPWNDAPVVEGGPDAGK